MRVAGRAGSPGAIGAALNGVIEGAARFRALLVATLCASAATLPFMSGNFGEISPYVVLGNPLTLTIIEVFAVPGALLGTALAPLGLDGPVWHWVGLGIAIVLWAARLIAAAPGATSPARSGGPRAPPPATAAAAPGPVPRARHAGAGHAPRSPDRR